MYIDDIDMVLSYLKIILKLIYIMLELTLTILSTEFV